MASDDVKAALSAAGAAKARNFERTMKIMKKAVLEVQLILLDGVNTDEQLQAAGKILSQSEYSDVVEERFIAKVCGYTRCANSLDTENMRKGRYRISLSAKKVYDLEESRHFCSPSCLITSKDFGNKLPFRQDLLESAKMLEEILSSVRGSQYTARSKPTRLKEDNVIKPSARPRNVKRGKLRSKETRKAAPASSDLIDSTVEGRGHSEIIISSSKPSGVPADKILTSDNPIDFPSVSSGFNAKDTLIVSELNQNNNLASELNPSYHSVLIVPSTSNFNGKDAKEIVERSTNTPKKHLEKDSLQSSDISSKVETKFGKLSIQERVGDQPNLPIFDYGGASDAIEGYVPLRSRNKVVSSAESKTKTEVSKDGNSSGATSRREQEEQRKRISVERNTSGKEPRTTLRDKVLSSERSSSGHQNEAKVFKEWEGLLSGSSEIGPAKMCITEMDGGTAKSAAESSAAASAASTSGNTRNNGIQGKPSNLKPALKKQAKVKKGIRNVVWADQDKTAFDTGITDSKGRSSSTKVDKALITEDGFEDVKGLEDKIKSMQLEEKELPQTKLVESNLDTVMAARLASAEAIANALTEAATSAATGEVDGSDAVAQAGLSILSATHNAIPARAGSPHEAQDRSGEIPDSMKNCAVDEDELYERAVQAREEIRRLKMPRKHEVESVEEHENDDLIDDLDLEVDANFDDDGDADDDDDDDDDDTSGGFEGASEVGFMAPPKGFKAEGKLIKNMSFVEALPPLSTKQWRMLVIVLLDALSVQRLPRLGVHLMNNRSVLRKVLDSTGTSESEYDVFRDVLLPLGRSPTFSTLSGG
uniref:RNA polymerase II subunit B1 CTD phosphatase RPAP2 homolog n=1 Tax=Physcomitrium patens TaxID=3218 RepID=A0A7I4DW90_PHYPA